MANIAFPGIHDNQVFEYSNTLSYLIPDGQRHLKAGAPVVISKKGGVAGILVTNIRPATEPPIDFAALQAKSTYGLNGPNHASVRVKGGVFRIAVASVSGSAVAGDPVYLKATTGNSGEPVVSTAASGADVILGTLYAAPKGSGAQELLVVLDPKPISA